MFTISKFVIFSLFSLLSSLFSLLSSLMVLVLESVAEGSAAASYSASRCPRFLPMPSIALQTRKFNTNRSILRVCSAMGDRGRGPGQSDCTARAGGEPLFKLHSLQSPVSSLLPPSSTHISRPTPPGPSSAPQACPPSRRGPPCLFRRIRLCS